MIKYIRMKYCAMREYKSDAKASGTFSFWCLPSVFLFALLISFGQAVGQTCDPCFAILDNGDWDDPNSWSDTSGGSATTNIPGNNTDVHVGENGAITINLNVDANADNVTVYNGGTLFYTAPGVRLRTLGGSTLTIQSGGSLNGSTETAADLVLRGDLVLDGAISNLRRIIVNSTAPISLSGSGTIDLSTAIEGIGEIRINGTGIVTNTISTTIVIERLRLNNDGITLVNAAGSSIQCTNLRLYGTNGQLTNNGTITTTNNLQSNDATDSNTITNASTGIMTIGNNINITDATLTINNNGIFTHNNNFANIGGVETFTNGTNATWTTSASSHANINTFNTSASGNTLIYNSAGAQTIFVPSDGSYHNLTVQNAGTKSAAGSLVIDNDLTIGGSASLDVNTNAADLTIGGDWDNSGAGFTQGTRTVTFNGASAQTIGGTNSTNFYNLTLNNTSGVSPEFTLGISTNTDNILTMTSGNIDLASLSMTIGTAAATPGALVYTDGTFFNGSLTRFYDAATVADGVDAGLFPLSDTDGNSRPFYVTSPTIAPATGGTITVSITTSDNMATDVGPIDDNGTDIVRRHNSSWNVSTGGGLSGGDDFNLRGSGTGFGTIDALSDLRLMTTAGVVGTNGGAGGTTSNPIIDRTDLTLAELSNSFHVGSTNDTDSPLPIDLLSFEATFNPSGYVELKWSTLTELNNDFFTLERSTDGHQFFVLADVPGSGTTSERRDYSFRDEDPMPGSAYYRLTQTDFDGSTEIFDLVKASSKLSGLLSLYPNPSRQGKFNLRVNQAIVNEITMDMFNSMGVEIGLVSIYKNATEIEAIPAHQLAPGIYLVTIRYGSNIVRQKLVVR